MNTPYYNSLKLGLTALVPTIALVVLARKALCYEKYETPKRSARYPSLGSVEVHDEVSRKLLARAHELYPLDMHGPGTGHYVDLPLGQTRYWVVGPEEGRKVVLIPGLSMPTNILSLLVPHLTQNGFRVMLYDIYGRGYTEAPSITETRYTSEMYVTQLALLMDHIGWEKAAIFGASVGGGIAVAFAARFSQKVDGKVGFIASCGVMSEWEPPLTIRREVAPLYQYLKGTFIGKLFTSKKVPPKIEDPTTASTQLDEGRTLMRNIEELVRIQHYLLPGYMQAIASTLVDGPIRDLEEEYQMIAQMAADKQVDVILIWGTDDEIVDYQYALKMKKIIPSAELVSFQDAEHDVIVFHAQEVREAIVRFLNHSRQ